MLQKCIHQIKMAVSSGGGQQRPCRLKGQGIYIGTAFYQQATYFEFVEYASVAGKLGSISRARSTGVSSSTVSI